MGYKATNRKQEKCSCLGRDRTQQDLLVLSLLPYHRAQPSHLTVFNILSLPEFHLHLLKHKDFLVDFLYRSSNGVVSVFVLLSQLPFVFECICVA